MSADTKQVLRTLLRQRTKAMSENDRAVRGAAAAHRLIESEVFVRAQSVLIYLPLRDEIDTASIARHAWAQRKTVLVPRVDSDRGRMDAVVLQAWDVPLQVDRMGVRIPVDIQLWPADEIDLAVVPAMGFDRHGRRLGRGGGWYDRFLAGDFSGTACGLALEDQIVEDIPTEAHDQPVALLVTDRRIYRCGKD